jgi:hypothetical protein
MTTIFYCTHLRKFLFLFFFLSAFSYLIGQSFVNINAQLTGLSNSAASWGDYDNDKDLDILLSGEMMDGSMHIKLYRNESGVFEEVSTDFTGMKNGSVEWGDYDNDGDLDILATGNNTEERTFIYKNNGTEFTDINPGFVYFGAYSQASWSDFDNDGDLDVFITGGWNSKLYRNDGQDFFTDTEMPFIGLNSSRACWGDYDQDGDKDILLTGDTGGGMKLFYYANNQDSFEELELSNMGLSAGSVEWGDYDGDGDLDILMTGFNDNIEPETTIYRNDGNSVFTNIYAGLPPVAMGNASWGDADNDGDLDVALTGKLAGCGATSTAIYENQGNGIFNDITTFLTNAERSTVCWGDYDNDTDLDLLVMGLDNTGNSFSRIYRNDFSLPNILPETPVNMNMEMIGDDVLLSWDKAFDPQTSQNSLTYNVKIGLTPQEFDILSPMAHADDGYRKIIDFGNAGNVNQYTAKNLEPGLTYYWSVQTIDNTFCGSAFSTEQSFYLPLTFVEDQFNHSKIFDVYPNPASDYIKVKMNGENKQTVSLIIHNPEGKEVLNTTVASGDPVDISSLGKGIYFIKIISSDNSFEYKMIKQ